jgi:hypothetical protein
MAGVKKFEPDQGRRLEEEIRCLQAQRRTLLKQGKTEAAARLASVLAQNETQLGQLRRQLDVDRGSAGSYGLPGGKRGHSGEPPDRKAYIAAVKHALGFVNPAPASWQAKDAQLIDALREAVERRATDKKFCAAALRLVAILTSEQLPVEVETAINLELEDESGFPCDVPEDDSAEDDQTGIDAADAESELSDADFPAD